VSAFRAASVFENTKFFLADFLEPFVDLFVWGILERHPRTIRIRTASGPIRTQRSSGKCNTCRRRYAAS